VKNPYLQGHTLCARAESLRPSNRGTSEREKSAPLMVRREKVGLDRWASRTSIEYLNKPSGRLSDPSLPIEEGAIPPLPLNT
jgi:hypothetical protein